MTTGLIVIAAALGLALIGALVTVIGFQRWFIREVSGTSFFGRPAAERAAFADEVRRRGRFAAPLITLISRARGGQIPDGVDWNGTTAPLQCSRQDFERAVNYEPRTGDVFVVTQMKCGTTWMKQIVYEILMRGRGDLSDSGGRHIYGVSSWIESSWGVQWARCSERMWWGPWPDHVESWWRQAQTRPNVLFFHFEEMRADLGATVDRVAALLGVSLSDVERAEVIRKSGFDYMKAHEERFTMAPPTAFSRGGKFLVSGSAERRRDVSQQEGERIADFCRERFEGATYPFERFYPDLAASSPVGAPPQ